MNIILYNKLNYNIGIDIGDNITNKLIKNNMTLIIPELDEEYNINLVMGDNILATDNILLHNIKIKTSIKVIYLEIIVFRYYMIIVIRNKINVILYIDSVSFSYNIIPYIDRNIDIDNIKLKYEILENIKLIRKKINLRHIILTEDDIIILEEKLNKIINNIDIIPNQKLLDIKQNLNNMFFI